MDTPMQTGWQISEAIREAEARGKRKSFAKVIVVGPRDRDIPKDVRVVSTVAKTTFWSQLSPFRLGPCKLWGGYSSKTMENAWQYSKVYKEHVGKDGDPNKKWVQWARTGWANERAVRYPMGRGAVPEYSWWDGQRLGYIQARAKIYIPLYARLVKRTEAFTKLRRMYERQDELWLWDYDGYDRRKVGHRLVDVLTDPTRKMGHAFVLAMLLEWGENFYRE